ncbi:uncharacterized protein ACWYII_023944 [Salvelinus alpinus]|uniref:uncharacterized protein n=1 Tax=Salvelinus alpinus TaxID=8036 RepID=UPI0039FC4410
MDAKQQKKAEEFLLAEASFITNAFRIIDVMIQLCKDEPDCKVHVDEILHSIFFLGFIHKPQQFTPKDILGELMPALEETFPRPFESYTCKLPKRTPFSSVLDMVVSLLGPDEEIDILKNLQEIAKYMSDPEMKYQMQSNLFLSFINPSLKPQTTSNAGVEARVLGKYQFTSSTICVSQTKEVQRSYYGVSMSCNGRQEGQIMVAVSCLRTWNCRVSNAVMTYDPNTKKKRENFDHTFKLPTNVRCQAFNVKTGNEMHPCKSCHNLFGLETTETKMWPYGNCAEAESLSKLYNGEKVDAGQVVNDEVRMQVIRSVRADLQRKLMSIEYVWDGDYYIPQ